jgi:GT2 family glycosyltransferase
VSAVTAIVVVHRLDPSATRAALASLAASTGIELTITVVHNGDESDWPLLKDWCDDVAATAIHSPENRGFGAAVNLALREVPAHHSVFLMNDDAWVEPTTISDCALALAAAATRCISVAPAVVHADTPDRVDSMGVVIRPSGEGFNAFQGRNRTDLPAEPQQVLGPCFSAALFRAGAFTDSMVGPIAEHFFLYYEDVEWNIRARHLGYISVSAPNATAHHHHALSAREIGEDARYELVQRNLLLMATSMFSWPTVLRIWFGRCVVMAKGLVTGPHRAARLRSFGRALLLAPVALRRRTLRGETPINDAALFAFSAGHAPSIDTTDFRLTG